MKKTYEDPRNISLNYRKWNFTKDQLFATLDLAIKKQKKVFFVNKIGGTHNGLSGHIPFETKQDKDIAIVKGGTLCGQIVEKSMRNITGVFISEMDIDNIDNELYQENKKLRLQGELTEELVYQTLEEIKKKGKQFHYMRKGVNNIIYRTQPKTILELTDNYVTYGSKNKNRSIIRTVFLKNIGHIEKSTKKANRELLETYQQG